LTSSPHTDGGRYSL